MDNDLYFLLRLAMYRHSTDREVAVMMLMAYLSYMLSEVRFPQLVACRHLKIDFFFCVCVGESAYWIGIVGVMQFQHLKCFKFNSHFFFFWVGVNNNLICLAVILFECHSHCFLLRNCYVPLHLA